MWRSLAVWWLATAAIGWLAWPLAASVFPQAPARGYPWARALGLILLSYAYWLLGVLGGLPNNAVSLWAVAGIFIVVGLVSWARKRAEMADSLRREWPHILTVELLFGLGLLLYAAHKAYDSAIDHTEEPMDFAFLNASLRSPRMPPNDPWLAGYSISYYYFGYLIVALLTRLAGLPSGVGYNLGLAHTFALGLASGYALIYQLTRLHDGEVQGHSRRARLFAVLGGIALLLASNLEGPLEFLRRAALAPRRSTAGWTYPAWPRLSRAVDGCPVEPGGGGGPAASPSTATCSAARPR